MAPPPMRPADLAKVVVLDQLATSPQGVTVVVRRTIRRGVYESHLWVVPLDGGRPVAITAGAVRDTSPSVSPDGARVAFLRGDPHDDDAPGRLCVVPTRGGVVRTLAPKGRLPGFGAISEPLWSPDGTRLAFVAEVDPPPFIVGDRPPVGSAASRRRKVPSPIARRMVRSDWRYDGDGHLDHWSHLFVFDLQSGAAPRQVTRGDWGVSSIAWHPNGRVVAFVTDQRPDADVRPRPSVWGVDVTVGPRSPKSVPRELLVAAGGVGHPSFSADGRWIAAVGLLEADPIDDVSPGIVVGPADGSAPPWPLAPALDRPIGNWVDTDLNGWMVSGRTRPAWADDSTLVATVTDRGRSVPERFVIDSRTGRPVDVPSASERAARGPWAEVTTHSFAPLPSTDGSLPVVVLGTLEGRAMEVMTVDLAAAPDDRRFRTVTRFGSAWQSRLAQPEMRRVEVPGDGGPIETWIASPPGAGDAALPTVVDVHGGPLGCWAPAPHLEVIMLTGAGYRVVLPNIRGSTGYGGSWIRPQLGDWGGVDAADVLRVVDHVVGLGLAASTRLGVFGLSYGGFMVNWLVGTTDRFAAAVSENGVTNQINAWAGSDTGPDYCRASLLGDPFTEEGVAKLWRQSPLRHVSSVHTPLLMLQAESDVRCPASDNEQFFIALRHLGRAVEYVLYPDEYHVYAASGRPDRRIDRMQRVLDWFAAHL